MKTSLTPAQRRAAFLRGAESGCRSAGPLALATAAWFAMDANAPVWFRVLFGVAAALLVVVLTVYVWRAEERAGADPFAITRFDPTMDEKGPIGSGWRRIHGSSARPPP